MLKFLLWLVASWVTWGIKVQFQVACLLKEPTFASLLLTWLLARKEVMKAGGITKSQRFSDELHSPLLSEDYDNPHPITILGHESQTKQFTLISHHKANMGLQTGDRHLSAYAFRENGANRWQRRDKIYLAITDFQIIGKGYRIIAYKHANTIAETEEMQF
uniref:Uncharacterized protein n=1 Tax=Salix viminalis TaxID=40686 RepID=A0A6N2LIN2_SALVM